MILVIFFESQIVRKVIGTNGRYYRNTVFSAIGPSSATAIAATSTKCSVRKAP